MAVAAMPDTRATVPVPGSGDDPLVMSYLGHSTVLVELDGARILTDPILRTRVGPLVRAAPPIGRDAWSGVAVVLLSHSHWDHLDLGSLRLLGADVRLIVPRGMGRRLRARGFRDVVEVVPGDTLPVGGLTIETVPALHRGFGPPIGPTELAVGYVIGGSRSVYFAGDTALFDGLRALDRGLDLALIPVWGWGPRARPSDHLDPLGAAEAVRLIRPRVAVPIHWGTLHPVGMRWVRPDTRVDPPHAFERHALELAPDTQVRVIPIGGSLRIGVDGPSDEAG
jgi:L-ascorbate metabolism protein UlaG (beta-lactamase superfamily)